MLKIIENRLEIIVLICILIFAFIIRIIGIENGAPLRLHGDETRLVIFSLKILAGKLHNLDVFFRYHAYPTLFPILNAIVYAMVAIINVVFKNWLSFESMKTVYYSNPFYFNYISRLISIFFGTFSIVAIYILAKKIFCKKVGFVSAALLSCSFIHVRNSHFGTVDILLTFLVLVALIYTYNIMTLSRRKDYIFAGIFWGLALATKYNVYILLITVCFSHILRDNRKTKRFIKEILNVNFMFFLLLLVGTFLIFCPLPLINGEKFLNGLMLMKELQSQGKIGTGGHYFSLIIGDIPSGFSFWSRNSLPDAIGVVNLWSAIFGIFIYGRQRKKVYIFLIIPIILLYSIVSITSYKAIRQILPIIPLLIIFSSAFFYWFSNKILKYKKLQQIVFWGISGSVILTLCSRSPLEILSIPSFSSFKGFTMVMARR